MADEINKGEELEVEQQAASDDIAQAESQDKVTAAKSDKPVKKHSKKPGFFSRVAKWFRDLKAEAKKVIWPTRKQVMNNTVVVIILVVIVAAFVAGLDVAFGFIHNFLATLVG